MLKEEEMMPAKTLAYIQSQVKAPKGEFNSFGKYKYRTAEGIVEAVKPIINPLGYFLLTTDEVVLIGNRFYVKCMAILSNGNHTYEAEGWSREEESKKGMDASQITGSAASYAKKRALESLFALSSESDADATNTHGNEWADTIQGCTTMEELMSLYKQNKDQVDGNPGLKKLFAEQKTKVK
jgi:hypothetical protein